jgi:hypothetical protein
MAETLSESAEQAEIGMRSVLRLAYLAVGVIFRPSRKRPPIMFRFPFKYERQSTLSLIS